MYLRHEINFQYFMIYVAYCTCVYNNIASYAYPTKIICILCDKLWSKHHRDSTSFLKMFTFCNEKDNFDEFGN